MSIRLSWLVVLGAFIGISYIPIFRKYSQPAVSFIVCFIAAGVVAVVNYTDGYYETNYILSFMIIVVGANIPSGLR